MKSTKLNASLKFTARGFSTKMGNLYFAQAFKSFILLKKYLANFHPKIIGLTGTNDQIETVKKKYKIFSKKVMDVEKKNENSTNHAGHDHGGYGVDHTTIIYLMDKGENGTHETLVFFKREWNELMISFDFKEFIK